MSSGRAPEWATGGGDEEGNDALLDAPELRVVLLGTIGSGKTLSGDTLLWRSEVAAPQRSGLQCVWRRGAAEGRRLSVVVGPRWLWRQGRLEEGVRQETERALALCAPGPHAFLLVVPVGQFSELDLQAAREICHMFGEAALARHGLLLLTCGDYLGGASVDDHLLTAGPELREVLAQCGGRCHVLNNRRPADRAQVRQLLEKVEEMV
uniref:AIG1-type G domain-containing protein n=2 Tax=Lepisosteus oculatus TaxID=7918 RepID=W5N2E8_LEPOC